MKILILVLSYTEWPFNEFMRLQQSTWDANKHSDIDTVYYYGGNKGVNGNELSVDCSDDYEMMHWKFKLALDQIDYHNYDFIFRTNSCSYIVKNGLYEQCLSLPKTECYSGYQNGNYISGAGIFFTPDVLDILRDELTNKPHGAEDVLIGSILMGRIDMINDTSRIDAAVEGFNFSENKTYHYRAKTSNDLSERGRDIESLKQLHKHLTK